jgi:hypothetical protein
VQEGGRRQQPEPRVLPAQQRLHAGHRPVAEVDQRLEHHAQLVAPQRVPQLDRRAAAAPPADLSGSPPGRLGAVAAVLLRQVHRGVRAG